MKKIPIYFLSALIGVSRLAAQFPVAESAVEETFASQNSSAGNVDGQLAAFPLDLVIEAPDRCEVRRCYLHNERAWTLYPHTRMVVGEGESGVVALVGEPSGNFFFYAPLQGESMLTIDVGAPHLGPSIRVGEVSHFANKQLQRIDESYVLRSRDGSCRTYERCNGVEEPLFFEERLSPEMAGLPSGEQYRLVRDALPSGNEWRYTYDDKGRLSSVKLFGGDEVSCSATLSYDTGKVQLEVEGKEASYRFEEGALTDVTRTDFHDTRYVYGIDGRLLQEIFPEGRGSTIEYDSSGKVAALFDTIDSGTALRLRFTYAPGRIEALNPNGGKDVRLFDSEKREVRWEKWDESGCVQRVMRQFWKGCGLFSDLIGGTVEDGQGEVLAYEATAYDERHNVIELAFFGNLTGEKTAFVKLNDKGEVLNKDEVDCRLWRMGFSDDGLNLRREWKRDDGTVQLNTYQPGTDRLLSTMNLYRGKIVSREFRRYNRSGVCIEAIQDDGCGETVDALDQVTQREIIRTVVNRRGQPKRQNGYIWDSNSQKESYVMGIRQIYDSCGRMTRMEEVDERGEVLQGCEMGYDDKWRLSIKVDADGSETLTTYDPMGHVILVEVPAMNYSRRCRFDLRNNMVESIERHGDYEWGYRFEYDSAGYRIADVDLEGRRIDYRNDVFGRRIAIEYPPCLSKSGELFRPTYYYTYDLCDQVTSKKDSMGRRVVIAPTVLGKPAKVEYANGTYTLFRYNREGDLIGHVNREGLVTRN